LPFLAAVPLEFGLHGLGHAPTVGEAELGQHGARGGHAEVLDEVLAQKSHRHRIEQQRSLSGEANHAAFRIQLKQFLMIQIACLSSPSLSFELMGKVLHLE
jgi:hypothetical protein